MDQQVHKIGLVMDVGSTVCFIVKRPGKGCYKCHAFEAKNAKQAHLITVETAKICNEVFSRVRRVSRRVKKGARRRGSQPTPAKTAVAPPPDDSQNDEESVRLAAELAESEADVVAKAVEEEDKEAVRLPWEKVLGGGGSFEACSDLMIFFFFF